MNKLTRKHDQLTKRFLTDISIAKEFLAIHLAPELLDRCNLESLQIESGSYIEESLSAQYSDLVYRLDLVNNNGSAYIYCLLEHQSKAEELMPLRILKYQLAIIQNHLDKHKGKAELPIVAALVFYNGKKSPYPYHLDIASLFPDKEAYLQAPLGRFRLIDLTVFDDSKLLQHGKLALLEIVIKHINERNFANAVKIIISGLKAGLDSGISNSLLNSVFHYLMNARETEEIKQLVDQINIDLPNLKDDIMTYAEELIQKGKQEGFHLGEERAQLDIAREMLRKGMDKSLIAEITKLSLEQIKTLH